MRLHGIVLVWMYGAWSIWFGYITLPTYLPTYIH